MLYTYVHHKEYSDVSWGVAHLYEHLVIHSFQLYLKSLNIHPGLIGQVSGDTFEHIIFLNATFYDKRVANAYERFLAAPALVEVPSVPQVLLEVEAEEKVTLILRDKATFDNELRSLITKPWIENTLLGNSQVDETTTVKEVFQIKRTAKEFRDVIVGVYVDVSDLDNDEQALFLRLSAIVGDVVDTAIRIKLHSAYYIGSSAISKDDTYMGNIHLIRFKRAIPLRLIKKTAEDALRAIDIQSAMPLIVAHFEEFADRATWKSFVVDYYRHTGILTNTKHISSLATPERIVSILSKLKIHVRVMQKGDEEWFS